VGIPPVERIWLNHNMPLPINPFEYLHHRQNGQGQRQGDERPGKPVRIAARNINTSAAPILAPLSAGASLTPSPVTATNSPGGDASKKGC